MSSKATVGLLCAGIIYWVSLPTAGSQNQGGYSTGNAEDSMQAGGAMPLADDSVLVERKAHNPNPPNGACGVTSPLLSWTPGFTAFSHDLYWGTSPNLGSANLIGRLPKAQTQFYIAPSGPGTCYWRVDEVEQDGVTIYEGDVWCFTIGSSTCAAPYGIVNSCCDAVLTWPPVAGAVAYQVYFSDDGNAVAARSPATDKGTTPLTVLSLGALQSGITYYWVVDLVTADGVYYLGEVRSYTAQTCPSGGVLREWWLNIPGTSVADLTNDPRYPEAPDGRECLDGFEGPTDWADHYGSRLIGWLLPPVSGEYTFWIASDDDSELWLSTDDDPANMIPAIAKVVGWTGSREWDKYPEQKSHALTLEAGQKYYMMALMKEHDGGDNIAVAWQGPGMLDRKVIGVPYVEHPACTPLVAHRPYPRDGDVYVEATPLLSWRAGPKALEHDVYFSDNYELVVTACPCTCAAYRGRQSQTTYDPGPLEPGRKYYWRIDQVNSGDPASPWRGCVWSFTVADDCGILLDNFETYTDFHPIQDHWGSTPENAVTLEQTMAHGGWQSMRLDYGPSAQAWRKELPQIDGTMAGVSSLCLWIHGGTPRFQQTATDCYTMIASGTDIWGTADEFRYAYKPLAGDGTITARVRSITNTNSWAKAGVMIRATLDPGSTHAMVVVTPGQGISFQRRLVADSSSADTTLPGIVAPYWVRLTRQGNTLSAEHSPDGTTWTDFAPGVSSVTIPMPASVYIGLALTAHNPDAVTEAQFCPVSLTENITGSWQVADIGVAQPGTESCPLYVSVEDSAGHRATVPHPENPFAVLSGDWKQWCIPLTAFTGVNPALLQKVVIAVGDPLTPSPGCTGWICIDDICLR
jgi:hypothetical protein